MKNFVLIVVGIFVIAGLILFIRSDSRMKSNQDVSQINSEKELSTLIGKMQKELQKGNTLFVAKGFRAISIYYIQSIDKIDYEECREAARKGFSQYGEEFVNSLAKGLVFNLTTSFSREAANASYCAGTLFEDLLEWEEALNCYQKAVKLEPENQEYQEAVSRVNKKQHLTEKVRQVFDSNPELAKDFTNLEPESKEYQGALEDLGEEMKK